MAPEQARGQDVDKRADIWAFGVIVHEMLTGRQLFAAETVSDTIAQVLTREFDSYGIPSELEPLLERCLVRDRRMRLRDIGDTRWLLDRKTSSVVQPPARLGSLWPWWTALAGVAVLACVFAFLWFKPSSMQPQRAVRFALGTNIYVKLSPDGSSILDTSSPLRVRAIDSVEWRTIPYTEGARNPFWSADSSMIGFFVDGRLRAVRADGRSVLNLAAAPSPNGGSWRGGGKERNDSVLIGRPLAHRGRRFWHAPPIAPDAGTGRTPEGACISSRRRQLCLSGAIYRGKQTLSR